MKRTRTVLKRPKEENRGQNDQSHDLSLYLHVQPAQSGFLEKKGSGIWRWQQRYFQQRGPFLMYWRHSFSAQEGTKKAPFPLGAIDLRRVIQAQVESKAEVLQLSSRSQKISLRLPQLKEKRRGSLERDMFSLATLTPIVSNRAPTINDWLEAIIMHTMKEGGLEPEFTDIAMGNEGVDSSLVSSPSLKTNDFFSYNNNQIVNRKSEENMPKMVEMIDKRIPTTAFDDKNDNTNDVEKKERHDSVENDHEEDETSSEHKLEIRFSRGSQGYVGLGKTDIETVQNLPEVYVTFLMVMGILPFSKSNSATAGMLESRGFSRIYLWTMRSLFLFSYIYGGCNQLLFFEKSGGLKGFLHCSQEVSLPLTYFACTYLRKATFDDEWVFLPSSLNETISDFNTAPCIFVYSQALYPIFFALTSSIILARLCYTFDNNGIKDTLITHRNHCAESVNRFARYCFFMVITTLIIFEIGTLLSSYFTAKLLDWENGKFVRNLFENFWLWFVISLSFSPFIAIILVFYAETRRIRFLVADYLHLFRSELSSSAPSFEVLNITYAQLYEEFEHLTSEYGLIITVLVIGFSTTILFCFVATYFIGFMPRDVLLLFIWSPTATILSTMGPLFLLLRSIVKLNDTSACVADSCTESLISLPPASCFLQYSHPVDEKKIESNENSGPSEEVWKDVRVSMTSQALSLDAMRLITLVDRRSCQFLLLGYRVDGNDAAALIGFLVAAQLLSFVGLDWLVG